MPSPQASIDPTRTRIGSTTRPHFRRWHWIAVVLLLVAVGCGVWIRIEIARAEPILRAKIIETLSARFHSRVELAELHVWLTNGLHVEGGGLKIFGLNDPNPWAPGVQPLIR